MHLSIWSSFFSWKPVMSPSLLALLVLSVSIVRLNLSGQLVPLKKLSRLSGDKAADSSLRVQSWNNFWSSEEMNAFLFLGTFCYKRAHNLLRWVRNLVNQIIAKLYYPHTFNNPLISEDEHLKQCWAKKQNRSHKCIYLKALK